MQRDPASIGMPDEMHLLFARIDEREAPLGFVVDHFEETAGCDTPTFRALAVGRAAGAARTSWMAISRSRFTAALDDPKRRGRLVLGTCVGSLHVYAPSVTLEARSWSSAS